MERVQNSVVIIRWHGFGFLEKSVRFLPDCCFQLLYYWLLLLNCCCSYVDQLKQTLLFQVDPFLEEIVYTLQWCSYAYSVEMDVEITTNSKVVLYFGHGWISGYTIAIDEPLDTQSSPVAPLECPTWGWAKQGVLFNEHAELRAESTFQWTNSQRTLQLLRSTLSWPSDNWFTIEMEKLTLLLHFRYCPWLISFTTPCTLYSVQCMILYSTL